MKSGTRYLALLLAILLLTGCSANTSRETADNYAVMETVAAQDMEGQAESGYGRLYTSVSLSEESAPVEEGRKIIKTVRLNAETEDFDALLQGVSDQIEAVGGYVENKEVYRGSAYDKSPIRNASLTIRVPAHGLAEFVTQVESMSNITSNSETGEDVTLTYADTESRVKALEVERDRLLELMEKAQTTQDLLEIEARLTDVRYELESAASRLKIYDNLVTYATVHLDIQEVRKLTPTAPPTTWERITGGFAENLETLGRFFVNLFVVLAAGLPIWLPLALVAGAVIFLAHRSAQKRREKAREARENRQDPQ